MNAQSDQELVAAWQAGHSWAGDELVRRHYEGVLRFFEVRVPRAADDLAQRTFTECWAARDRYAGKGTFRSFLYGVARNQLLVYLREVSRAAPAGIDDGETPPPGLTTLVTRRKEQQLLLRALVTLDIDHQIALGLFYWEGMSTAEIGDVLGIPGSTVRSRMAKARSLLRGMIERLSRPGRIRDALLGDLDGWARGLPGRPPDQGPQKR